MTPGAAIVLIGLGLGTFVVAGRSDPRAPTSPRERADTLRARAVEAQLASARASRIARELMERWSRAEDDARLREDRR